MNLYNYKGAVCTIKELSELSGIAPATLRDRLRRGYTVDQAVRPVTTYESVERFCDASQWSDWIDVPISDVYQVYWKWCGANGYTPAPIQGFSRHLFALNPWLKTVPNKRGNKSFRVIRKR